MSKIVIAQMTDRPHDEPGMGVLLHDSKDDGHMIVERMLEEWDAGVQRFDRPGEALFAAWHGDEIIGIGGRIVDPYLNDPTIARVRRVYVRRSARRLGVGCRLLAPVIDLSGTPFTRLILRTWTQEADRFYQTLGFIKVEDVHATHQFRYLEAA